MYDLLMYVVDKKSKQPKIDDEPNLSSNIFLNRLLRLKDKFTLQQMKEQVFTIAGAGYETTGTASAHCILFLALNPSIQQKVYEEVMKMFPTDDDPITLDALSQLDYLDRVMKESLRLAPTVHAVAREATEDFELSPGKVNPRGTIFVINIYGLQRRTDVWGADAADFNPDRFLPENYTAEQQKCFIPFSAGKRNCIGYRYALFSFKVLMVKMVKNFHFTTPLKTEEIQFNRQIALKLVGEHLISITLRNPE